MKTWDELTEAEQRRFAIMMGHIAHTLLEYGKDIGLEEAVGEGDAGMAFVNLGMAQFNGVFPLVRLGDS